jgi:hypothetical protein
MLSPDKPIIRKLGFLTKTLAIIGNLLVWLPILAPVFIFRFDYLIPAELFPIPLVGSLLLLWGARRARMYQKLIGMGIVFTILILIGGQVIASITGLASGEIEPTGWPWALVLGSIMFYILALVVIGIGGLLLLRDSFFLPQKEPIV